MKLEENMSTRLDYVKYDEHLDDLKPLIIVGPSGAGKGMCYFNRLMIRIINIKSSKALLFKN